MALEMPVLDEYGVEDCPECPLCGGPMRLSSRTPHEGSDEEFELQMFICSHCDVQVQRTVDEFGSLYR